MSHYYIKLDNKVSGIWVVFDRGPMNSKVNPKRHLARTIKIECPSTTYSEGQDHYIYVKGTSILVTPNEITIK